MDWFFFIKKSYEIVFVKHFYFILLRQINTILKYPEVWGQHKNTTKTFSLFMNSTTLYEKELLFQADRRKAAVEFIKIISDLWYDKSIELMLFRNQLIDRNVSDIMNLHEYAGEFVQKPINVFDTVEIARAIENLDLPPSRIDIGKLTYEYHLEDNKYHDCRAFVIDKLKNAKNSKDIKQKDVVLYGLDELVDCLQEK
jgi:glyceraldehyde 3-phosphate dehydrogenase